MLYLVHFVDSVRYDLWAGYSLLLSPPRPLMRSWYVHAWSVVCPCCAYLCVFIRVSFLPPLGLGLEEELPDYDLDSEDEEWLNAQTNERVGVSVCIHTCARMYMYILIGCCT